MDAYVKRSRDILRDERYEIFAPSLAAKRGPSRRPCFSPPKKRRARDIRNRTNFDGALKSWPCPWGYRCGFNPCIRANSPDFSSMRLIAPIGPEGVPHRRCECLAILRFQRHESDAQFEASRDSVSLRHAQECVGASSHLS